MSVARGGFVISVALLIALPAAGAREVVRRRLTGWVRVQEGGSGYRLATGGVERVSLWWGHLYRDQRTKAPIAWTRAYTADGAQVKEIWVYRSAQRDAPPEEIPRMLRIKTVDGHCEVTIHATKGTAAHPFEAIYLGGGPWVAPNDRVQMFNAELASHGYRRETEARANLVLKKKYKRRHRRILREKMVLGLVAPWQLAMELGPNMLEGVQLIDSPRESWPVILDSLDEIDHGVLRP